MTTEIEAPTTLAADLAVLGWSDDGTPLLATDLLDGVDAAYGAGELGTGRDIDNVVCGVEC